MFRASGQTQNEDNSRQFPVRKVPFLYLRYFPTLPILMGGGGGRSILIGGPLVTETKKHTKLLEAIKEATSKTPTVQVSGNVGAVIGR